MSRDGGHVSATPAKDETRANGNMTHLMHIRLPADDLRHESNNCSISVHRNEAAGAGGGGGVRGEVCREAEKADGQCKRVKRFSEKREQPGTGWNAKEMAEVYGIEGNSRGGLKV